MKQALISLFLFFCTFANAQNVGIGTAQPDHKLVVEGDRIKLQNKEGSKFLFLRTDGDEIDITTIGSHFWITAEEDNHIILNQNSSSTGNVGIGASHPKEKLDVDGNVKISSLNGLGNRLLYADSDGILRPSTIEISELQQDIQDLKNKLTEQEALIQDLIQRLEKCEQK